MKKILLLLIIISSGSVCAQSAFAKAEQLLSSKKYTQADSILRAMNKEAPNDLKVIQKLGEIQVHYKNYQEALDWFKMLINAQPNNADFNFRYGGTLGLLAKESSRFKVMGMLGDVKEHLKKAARLDPQHIQARHALSQIYCELPGIIGGSISKSKAYADELLKISPVDGHFAYGFIYEYEKEYTNAENSYKKALEIGGSLTCYRKLADLYEKRMKDRVAALKVLKKAFVKFPGDSALKKDITRLGT
jgi:tetratricopeptide (TPR) repeat protein